MSMADRIAVLNEGRLEQLATPQELYAEPVSRFVAAFIGTANLLDGDATADGVAVPGMGLVPASHPLAAGSPATAVVRPEDVTVGTEVSGGLRGTVVDTYFLGGASTISVEVPGLPAPLLASVHGATRLARGADVGVTFGRATAVPRDPSQPPSFGTTVPTTAITVTDAADVRDADGTAGAPEASASNRSQDVSA